MWTYKNEELPENIIDQYIGFVYLIINKTNNKKYIGKKLFKSTKTKLIKGKKKKIKTESDWKKYYGSNSLLKEDVLNLGPENFKREILMLCSSKGSMNYYEMKFQINHDALIRDDYYNEWISVKVHRSHIKDL